MKSWIISFFVVLILLQLTGCGKEHVAPQIEQNVAQTLSVPERIVIKYGDGNTLNLDDKKTIEKIINDLQAMHYTKVEVPDGVGQNFTIEISNNTQYSSPGYIISNKHYYKSTDQKLILELNKLLVDYGRVTIPELLPGV